MPESFSSFGELMEPALTITSRRAATLRDRVALAILDADGAPLLEQDARRERLRAHGEIRPVHGWLQVRVRRAAATPIRLTVMSRRPKPSCW